MPDGTFAPRCENGTCGGFGKCMTDPKHPQFNVCVPPPGTFVTTCSARPNVTELTAPDPGGPVIWGAQLVRSSGCGPTQRAYTLSFSYFDAEGDGPYKEFGGVVLQADFGFTNPPMNLLAGAVALQGNKVSGTAFMAPCVNASPLPASIAFVLVDTAGHRSNPLCVTIVP